MAETQNLYWEETENDGQALEAFLKNIYSKTNPFLYKYPILKDLNFWKFSGVKTSIFVSQAIGATILSGVRTGGLFFIIELKLLEKFGFTGFWANILGFIVMIAALFAFEGFLLGRGFSDGEKAEKINESLLGLWISTIVVVGGGIFSGLGITKIPENIDIWINTIIAIVTGCGSAGMTFFGAENISFALNKFSKKKEELEKKFETDEINYNELLSIWQQEGAEEFHKSKYNNRRKDSIYAPVQKPVQSGVQSGVQSEQKIEQNVQPVQEMFVVEKPLPIYEQIRIKIEKYVDDNHILPPVNKFSDENNFSKAYVSTGLNEYIFKNQKWLLGEGLVDLDRVQKAKNSVEKVKPGTTQVDEDGWPINN